MEFITFHVALIRGEAAHPNQTLKHREYLAMIAMMFASVRLFHRDVRTVVLTDESTDFGGADHHIDELVRSPVDGSRLMYERTIAQDRHVQSSDFSRPLVILDSDILLNASMDELLHRDFDVALTWRDNPEQPINGGLMILNNRRPATVKAFFRRFTEIFEQRYAKEHATWFGDQLALRDCIGLSAAELSQSTEVMVEGCRILLLPCESHNFSPPNRWAEIGTSLPGKCVLHFKGERKRLMAPYWRAWLMARSSWSPLVWARSLRERRLLQRLAAEEVASGMFKNANGGNHS